MKTEKSTSSSHGGSVLSYISRSNDSEKVEGLCEWLASGSQEARAYIKPYRHGESRTRSQFVAARSETASIQSTILQEKNKQRHTTAPYIHELKVVSDYTHDSFTELKKIDVLTFWRYYRDAIIYNCSKSDIGMEYLKKCIQSGTNEAR